MAKSATTKKKETFTYYAPDAQNVVVAGDFTGWDLNPKPLKKNKDGTWKATLPLETGRHEYRYIVDGQWCDDPQCPELAPNPYGGANCVRFVT